MLHNMCFDTYVCLLRVKAKSNPPTAKTPLRYEIWRFILESGRVTREREMGVREVSPAGIHIPTTRVDDGNSVTFTGEDDVPANLFSSPCFS
uniref:Uncharacterized protein n=1 Tax=Helianthus annuus TaxID=4232 RepID=A0A251UH71_HELAN